MKRNRSRRRRWLVLGISVAVLAAAAAVATQLTSSSADGSPVIGVTNIDLHDEAFSPPVIQVTQGATVTWKFSDGGTEHNIVGEGWGIETPQSTGTFEHAFTQPGRYFYKCTLHFRMDGRVDVVSAPGASK
jgi:plastocyanin